MARSAAGAPPAGPRVTCNDEDEAEARPSLGPPPRPLRAHAPPCQRRAGAVPTGCSRRREQVACPGPHGPRGRARKPPRHVRPQGPCTPPHRPPWPASAPLGHRAEARGPRPGRPFPAPQQPASPGRTAAAAGGHAAPAAPRKTSLSSSSGPRVAVVGGGRGPASSQGSGRNVTWTRKPVPWAASAVGSRRDKGDRPCRRLLSRGRRGRAKPETAGARQHAVLRKADTCESVCPPWTRRVSSVAAPVQGGGGELPPRPGRKRLPAVRASSPFPCRKPVSQGTELSQNFLGSPPAGPQMPHFSRGRSACHSQLPRAFAIPVFPERLKTPACSPRRTPPRFLVCGFHSVYKSLPRSEGTRCAHGCASRLSRPEDLTALRSLPTACKGHGAASLGSSDVTGEGTRSS